MTIKIYTRYIAIIISSVLLCVGCSEDTIDAQGLGAIEGKVVAAGTNEPLANVKITTNPSSSTVFTDAEGVYRISDVSSGEYSLTAQKDGLLAQFESVTVVADGTVEVVVEMSPETAANKAPQINGLLVPEEGAIDQPIELTLTWSAEDPEDDTLTYTVTLKNDRNTTVELFENIADTTYTVSELLYGTKYFWQVTATDGINTPVNSTIATFQTIAPPNNRIFYTRAVADNSVIYSSDETGQNEIRLTALDKNSFRPRKSPTTQRIAFLQLVGTKVHLFTMNTDGAQLQQITTNVPVVGFNLGEIDYAWSDNGAKLWFPNQDTLYSINADGSGLQQVYKTTNGKLISSVAVNDALGIIALKTNNLQGYEVEVFTITTAGQMQDMILSGVKGAAGGVHLSIDGSQLVYTHDISGFENAAYRQLDTHMFLYTFSEQRTVDMSIEKPMGTNDTEARFSPNQAMLIYTHAVNDGVAAPSIQIIPIANLADRTQLIDNAMMADWK